MLMNKGYKDNQDTAFVLQEQTLWWEGITTSQL
jgi:hypothetical protein